MNKKQSITSLEGIEENANIIIVGAGSTLKSFFEPINNYVNRRPSILIGVNYMTGYWIPSYHLWTNKQRYRDFGQHINETSMLLLKHDWTKSFIRKHHKGSYVSVDYVDRQKTPVKYDSGKIYGCFRTAGVLAIMIAHIMKAKEISIVGMDGYTLHSQQEIGKKKKNQHCYGKGHTDDSTWEECVAKDKMVYESLRSLKDFGINFHILTPTVFKDFYTKGVL